MGIVFVLEGMIVVFDIGYFFYNLEVFDIFFFFKVERSYLLFGLKVYFVRKFKWVVELLWGGCDVVFSFFLL